MPVEGVTDNLQARPLKPDQLDKAFALIQIAFEDVSLERWRRHVHESVDMDNDHAGWIAVEDDKDYIHGLVAYHVKPDLMCGRTLIGHDIIIVGVALGQVTICAVEGLSRVARHAGCDAVHINRIGSGGDAFDRGHEGMLESLLQYGFVDRGTHFCLCRIGACPRS